MAKNTSPSLLLWLGIALVVLLADQFTKLLIVGSFQLGDSQNVTSFFNL
ncbi:MAG: signal peptidase II, partial [Betaproteobacteria bacterium]|nr:signal peptidase II [Betaproteobacteria bacterium]